MFAQEIATITPDWPTWVFVMGYLSIGLVIGLFVVQDGKCEDPATAMTFAMLAGGVCVLLLITVSPLILAYFFCRGICSLLGIEASQSDNHGV